MFTPLCFDNAPIESPIIAFISSLPKP